MQAAGDPIVFEQRVKSLSDQEVNAVNLSVLGATTTISHDIFRSLLVPHQVHTIFYGIEMRALRSGEDATHWMQTFHDAPLGYTLPRQPGLEQSVLLWLMEHSTLVQYRTNIRDWLSGQFPVDDPLSMIDIRGKWLLDGIHSRDSQVIRDQFVPFQTDNDLKSGLEAIFSICQQPEMRCFILNMPLHEAAHQYIPPQDMSAYKNLLLTLASRAHLQVWDFDTAACFESLGDSAFFDLNHLNNSGAQKFTEWLAALYAGHIGNGLCADQLVQPEGR